MEAYQERVLDEEHALFSRMDALSAFIGSAAFPRLDIEHRVLLRDQLQAMRRYQQTLVKRLSLWGLTPRRDPGMLTASPTQVSG